MSEDLKAEFERLIEDTSGGTHNSQWWWDQDSAGDGVTIIEDLCDRLYHAAERHFRFQRREENTVNSST